MEKIVSLLLSVVVGSPKTSRLAVSLVGCILFDLLVTSDYPVTALFLAAVSVLFFLSLEDD
jgi:hypothetical protein